MSGSALLTLSGRGTVGCRQLCAICRCGPCRWTPSTRVPYMVVPTWVPQLLYLLLLLLYCSTAAAADLGSVRCNINNQLFEKREELPWHHLCYKMCYEILRSILSLYAILPSWLHKDCSNCRCVEDQADDGMMLIRCLLGPMHTCLFVCRHTRCWHSCCQKQRERCIWSRAWHAHTGIQGVGC